MIPMFHTRVWTAALLSLLAAVVWPGALTAQDIGARAYLSQSTVGMGRSFVLNLEISGSQQIDGEPEIPDLSAFATYLGSGTSTSMQIVNNRTTVSFTIQYRYQALEEGTFEIPSIEVTVAGQTCRTEPLQLTVSATAPAAPQRQTERGDPLEIAPEDLFVTAEASRSSVRDGEPFIVEYRIFTRVDVSSYGFTHIPEPQGFWVEELPMPGQPQVEQVVRNGQQYTSAVIRRVALVPTGSGERTIEGLGIEAQVRVRRTRALDPFQDLFDFDRSSLFGTVVPTTVTSNPLTVQVAPLPPGRPEPFSGVVGSLDLTTTLDRDTVDANEAVTLTVRASGRGNLRAVPEPALELPMDFEAFPPEVSESVEPTGSGLTGSKTWQYVLIPRAPGTRTLPSVSLGYFDSGSESYRTATTEPLPLVVTGEVVEGPAALVRGGIGTLREDIRFIHLGSPGLTHAERSLFRGAGFWLVLLLPVAGIMGARGIRRHRDRLEGDVAYARRRRASRLARRRLAGARRLASSGDSPRAFYAEAARALRGFVADKLNVAEAGMQMSEAEAELRRRGVPEGTIAEVAECLEACDRGRFAPPGGDTEELTRFLDRVGSVMTALQREIGR